MKKILHIWTIIAAVNFALTLIGGVWCVAFDIKEMPQWMRYTFATGLTAAVVASFMLFFRAIAIGFNGGEDKEGGA